MSNKYITKEDMEIIKQVIRVVSSTTPLPNIPSGAELKMLMEDAWEKKDIETYDKLFKMYLKYQHYNHYSW